MLKWILIVGVVFLPFLIFSQIEKGTILTGGSLGFQYSGSSINKNFTLYENPMIGGFVAKNLLLGAQPSFGYSQNSNSAGGYSASTHVSLGPIIRYYLKIGDKTYFFTHARAGIGNTTTRYSKSSTGVRESDLLVNWQLGPGLCVRLRQNIGLEVALLYNGNLTQAKLIQNGNTLSTSKAEVAHGVLMNVGFNIFFDKKKK